MPTKKLSSQKQELIDLLKPADLKFIAAFLSNKPTIYKDIKPASPTRVQRFYEMVVTGKIDDMTLRPFLIEVPISKDVFMDYVKKAHKKVEAKAMAKKMVGALLEGKDLTVVHLADYLMRYPSPTSFYSQAKQGEETKTYSEKSLNQVARIVYGDRQKVYESFLSMRESFYDLREVRLKKARAQAEKFHKKRSMDEAPLDGFVDIGPDSTFAENGLVAQAGLEREVLIVDRPRDETLQRWIRFAFSLKPFEEERRLAELQQLLCREFHPAHKEHAEELQIQKKEVFVGNVLNPDFPGLCRHRAILFHILAKKAGLASTLHAGERPHEDEPTDPFDHAWCEVKIGKQTHVVDMLAVPLFGEFGTQV